MSQEEKEQLAKVVTELVNTNGKVRSAIMDCACSCPNLVVQY